MTELVSLRVKEVKSFDFITSIEYESTLEDQFGNQYILYDRVNFENALCEISLERFSEVNYITSISVRRNYALSIH